MALEKVAPALQDLLHRVVLLVQGPDTWWKATCLATHDSRLSLAVLVQPGAAPPEAGPARVQVTDGTGVLRLSGLLAGPQPLDLNGVTHAAWSFSVDPSSAQRWNRRAHFRVPVGLKGELSPLGAGELEGSLAAGGRPSQPHLEALARKLSSPRHPCVVRDLSTGGALVAMASPGPLVGQHVLLDVALENQDVLRNLPAVIVESSPEALAKPFDARVRLRFEALPTVADGRLARHVIQVQRTLLQKGVRG